MVEGPEEDVVNFVGRLKELRWKAIAVRAEEMAESAPGLAIASLMGRWGRLENIFLLQESQTLYTSLENRF